MLFAIAAKAMLDEYDMNEDTPVGDPDKFLNDLQAQGLITPVG